jgi:hypothetical protein
LITKAGFVVNTNFSDGIENIGRFDYSSSVRLQLDFLEVGFNWITCRKPPVESLWIERQGQTIGIDPVTCPAKHQA